MMMIDVKSDVNKIWKTLHPRTNCRDENYLMAIGSQRKTPNINASLFGVMQCSKRTGASAVITAVE